MQKTFFLSMWKVDILGKLPPTHLRNLHAVNPENKTNSSVASPAPDSDDKCCFYVQITAKEAFS